MSTSDYSGSDHKSFSSDSRPFSSSDPSFPRSGSSRPAARRSSSSRLDRLDRLRRLTARDHLLLSWLAEHYVLTTGQVARAITERLRNGYIRNPHVSVEVEVYRPFFILGEVNAPGQYPYVPNMTVEAAIAVAGGFAPRANKNDILVARNYNGEVMRARALPDFPMRPGDTVTVRERWF